MSGETSTQIIQCPTCGVQNRIPRTTEVMRVSCFHCRSAFWVNRHKHLLHRLRRNSSYILVVVGVLVVFLGYWFYSNGSPWPRGSKWITISYGGLVDGSVITHNGETVEEVIAKLSANSDNLDGLVQPYLEPFSLLCHDVLLAEQGPDSVPLINILLNYLPNAEVPAWVALAREGHFQIYYNQEKIRVFIHGIDAETALAKHLGIIRHPLRSILESSGITIQTIETYVFTNSYASQTIKLNVVPLQLKTVDLTLDPTLQIPNLAGISDLLDVGVRLEAVEVDDDDNLHFYGHKDSTQTLAGFPLSLSDLAVAYRAVFHCGKNEPYISLDQHEDNRYAKVNFGGLLEDTRIGHVVLEADKLFKTMSTGIDPNTHKIMKDSISGRIPGFVTEDDRSFLDAETGHVQIRYWFYPDSIGTVTDGEIGAILSHRFIADVERTDKDLKVGAATRKTIDHLNANYADYSTILLPYRELDVVGRLIALFSWLQSMNMNSRIDLDAFLAVPVPAFDTPDSTKKMLAIASVANPSSVRLNETNVSQYTRVAYASPLIDKYGAGSTDSTIIDNMLRRVSNLDNSIFAPQYFKELDSTASSLEYQIKKSESALNVMESRISELSMRITLGKVEHIDEHNLLVDDYNRMARKLKSLVDRYNTLANKINAINLKQGFNVSIGGGINLRSGDIKSVVQNKQNLRLIELRNSKTSFLLENRIEAGNGWLRNQSNPGRIASSNLSVTQWLRSSGDIKESAKSLDSKQVKYSFVDTPLSWKVEAANTHIYRSVEFSRQSNELRVHESLLSERILSAKRADSRTYTFYH